LKNANVIFILSTDEFIVPKYFIGKNVTKFDPKVLQGCLNDWVDAQNALMQYYTHAFSSRDSYAKQLMFWDNNFPNSTIDDTIAHFDGNAKCATFAVTYLFNLIVLNPIDPVPAVKKLVTKPLQEKCAIMHKLAKVNT
jgi:hypothetical protein